MEQDSNHSIAEKYHSFKQKFGRKMEEDDSLLTRMFLLGLTMKSNHYGISAEIRKDKISLKPLSEKHKEQWDIDTLRKIQNGSDSVNDYEDIPDGILFLIHQLKQAIDYNRPDWGLFYLIGLCRGSVNAGEIEFNEFQYFHSLLAHKFVESHGILIKQLSDYFDEIGVLINFELKEDKVLVSLSKNSM